MNGRSYVPLPLAQHKKETRTVYLAQILESMEEDSSRQHSPKFRVVREARGWRMCDGDRDIGFCYPTFFDIWSFSPFEPPEIANPESVGKVVDLHTLHNTMINLAPHGWPGHWKAGGMQPDQCVTWDWVCDSEELLEAKITATFAQGERIQWVFRVRYDPTWARYRYTFDIDAWRLSADGMEPLNMMLAGALAERPECRRWTHSIWEDADGKLRRIVHSNALFHCTDYGAPADCRWRHRNVPYTGAWVAYAAHESFNPAVLIHGTNVPIRLAICSQHFDEHIIWADAGHEILDEDGLFHFRMSAEFVNLGPRMAQDLLAQAADPVRPKQWRHELIALPFHMDTVNSFEEPVDVWAPEDCPIIALPKGNDGPQCWADGIAHSGTHSVRLQAGAVSERQEVYPVGAVCRVKPHRTYRLLGWIRTECVERYARLELASYEYTFTNYLDIAGSPSVCGTQDWTQVEVELHSGDEAYLMPKLVLYGPGAAWFDDIVLKEKV